MDNAVAATAASRAAAAAVIRAGTLVLDLLELIDYALATGVVA